MQFGDMSQTIVLHNRPGVWWVSPKLIRAVGVVRWIKREIAKDSEPDLTMIRAVLTKAEGVSHE